MPKIVQIPLRQQVRDRIAEQLWKGAYAFGDDLNEARLAKELGISRTPLREGLVMLASEGLIEAHPNRGFHVPAVNSRAVEELYPVIASLESLAVASSSGDLAKLADDLDSINAKIKGDQWSRPTHNNSDAKWHERLVGNCENQTLRHELKTLWARSRSIDGALLRGLAAPSESAVEHAEIAASIRDGDLGSAAKRVTAHWQNGIGVVTTWIDTNHTAEATK